MYLVDVLDRRQGNSISITQFAIMFITPFQMTKFGKRWMYAAGMALLTFGFAGFGFFGTKKAMLDFYGRNFYNRFYDNADEQQKAAGDGSFRNRPEPHPEAVYDVLHMPV